MDRYDIISVVIGTLVVAATVGFWSVVVWAIIKIVNALT